VTLSKAEDKPANEPALTEALFGKPPETFFFLFFPAPLELVEVVPVELVVELVVELIGLTIVTAPDAWNAAAEFSSP
jgi:hypothetical protein